MNIYVFIHMRNDGLVEFSIYSKKGLLDKILGYKLQLPSIDGITVIDNEILYDMVSKSIDVGVVPKKIKHEYSGVTTEYALELLLETLSGKGKLHVLTDKDTYIRIIGVGNEGSRATTGSYG